MQRRALETVALALLRDCGLINMDGTVLGRAVVYRQRHNLQIQDATVLASVVLDLERGPRDDEALFVSQNVKDFEQQSNIDLLTQFRCKYLADFGNAVRYAERPPG